MSSTLLAGYVYGSGRDQIEELSVPAEANNWFANKLISSVPPGTSALSVQNFFPHLIRTASENLVELVNLAGGIDKAVAIVQKAYTDNIAPLDIPGIPNIVEPEFDLAMIYGIGKLLKAVWVKINENITLEPAPPPAPSPVA